MNKTYKKGIKGNKWRRDSKDNKGDNRNKDKYGNGDVDLGDIHIRKLDMTRITFAINIFGYIFESLFTNVPVGETKKVTANFCR